MALNSIPQEKSVSEQGGGNLMKNACGLGYQVFRDNGLSLTSTSRMAPMLFYR